MKHIVKNNTSRKNIKSVQDPSVQQPVPTENVAPQVVQPSEPIVEPAPVEQPKPAVGNKMFTFKPIRRKDQTSDKMSSDKAMTPEPVHTGHQSVVEQPAISQHAIESNIAVNQTDETTIDQKPVAQQQEPSVQKHVKAKVKSGSQKNIRKSVEAPPPVEPRGQKVTVNKSRVKMKQVQPPQSPIERIASPEPQPEVTVPVRKTAKRTTAQQQPTVQQQTVMKEHDNILDRPVLIDGNTLNELVNTLVDQMAEKFVSRDEVVNVVKGTLTGMVYKQVKESQNKK